MPIRQPTSDERMHAWYRAWLAGDDPAIHEGDPQPGYYKGRKWRLGPWLPVRIWLHQAVCDETGELLEPETLRCLFGDEEKAPEDVWTFIQPITPDEYRALREPRPTPAKVAYAWHRAAVAGEKPPRHKDHPQCGWFKTRMHPSWPWVPARIWLDREIDMTTGLLARPEELVCEVGPDRPAAREAWPSLIPISKADYDALVHRSSLIPAMFDQQRKVDLIAAPILPE